MERDIRRKMTERLSSHIKRRIALLIIIERNKRFFFIFDSIDRFACIYYNKLYRIIIFHIIIFHIYLLDYIRHQYIFANDTYLSYHRFIHKYHHRYKKCKLNWSFHFPFSNRNGPKEEKEDGPRKICQSTYISSVGKRP